MGAQVSNGNGAVHAHHGPRLVIAEDDDAIRLCLRTLLEIDHFDIVGEAATGRDAIARAIEQRPDVIILDQRMPQMPCELIATLIRGALPSVKIVAFSTAVDAPQWADVVVKTSEIGEVGAHIDGLFNTIRV